MIKILGVVGILFLTSCRSTGSQVRATDLGDEASGEMTFDVENIKKRKDQTWNVLSLPDQSVAQLSAVGTRGLKISGYSASTDQLLALRSKKTQHFGTYKFKVKTNFNRGISFTFGADSGENGEEPSFSMSLVSKKSAKKDSFADAVDIEVHGFNGKDTKSWPTGDSAAAAGPEAFDGKFNDGKEHDIAIKFEATAITFSFDDKDLFRSTKTFDKDVGLYVGIMVIPEADTKNHKASDSAEQSLEVSAISFEPAK